MTCCGRCKICRSEWEETEADRDSARREEERLRQEIKITWDILADGGVMCRELATQASGVMAYQKALEGRIEALLDLISDARPYLTNAGFMKPSDDEVEITRRMDRELAPRQASNAQGQPAATEPAQQAGRGPLGCADLLDADGQPERKL